MQQDAQRQQHYRYSFSSSCSDNDSPNYPCFTYTLSSFPNTLYVPITTRCNSKSLPETRGPNFLLPPAVVASLCRFRDASAVAFENDVHDSNATQTSCPPPQWEFWCRWLDTQETYQKLPPRNAVSSATDQALQSSKELHRVLIQQVLQQLYGDKEKQKDGMFPYENLVLAGEGEPTLELDLVQNLLQQIQQQQREYPKTIRLVTNGLVPSNEPNLPQRLASWGVTHVSIHMVTADPEQYVEWMQPQMPSDGKHAPLDIVLDFVQHCLQESNLSVEVTGLDHPEVDKDRLHETIESLPVPGNESKVASIRWRSYFP